MMLLGPAGLSLLELSLKQQALGLAAAYESCPGEQIVQQPLNI